MKMEQEQFTLYIKQYLLKRYEEHPYAQMLEISLTKIESGYVEMTMPVVPSKNCNFAGVVHGGAVASLADMVMGASCIACGKSVTTLDLNINYMKSGQPGSIITGYGKVIHHGRQTMVAEATISDQSGKILAVSRGTFFVFGAIEQP